MRPTAPGDATSCSRPASVDAFRGTTRLLFGEAFGTVETLDLAAGAAVLAAATTGTPDVAATSGSRA